MVLLLRITSNDITFNRLILLKFYFFIKIKIKHTFIKIIG